MSLKNTYRAVGYAQYTVSSTAVKLTDSPAQGVALPTDNDKRPRRAEIRIEGDSVRWRSDGTAPTAAIGMPLDPGDTLSFDGSFADLQFIRQTGDATINVMYFQ